MADELNKELQEENLVEEEVKEEKVVEETAGETDLDTANSEEPSEQKEEVAEEKPEENSDVPPPSGEKEETKEESDEPDVAAEEEPTEGAEGNEDKVEEKEEAPVEEELGEDVEKIKAELEELKEAEEERKGLADLNNLVQNAANEMDRVLNGIQKALNDTLDQYGIDKTKTLEELKKEDPAKAVIAEDLIRQANQVKEFNEANLGQQVQNKQNELIFKKAEKLFNKYNLSHEQAELAADTFINIMLNVGVLDLNVDLAAKVELSAARAKMLKPDVVEAKEEQIIEAPIEYVEDVADIPPAEETAEDPKAEETKEEEPEKKEPEAVVEKPDIEALKEGVAENTSEAHHPDRVTVDNVLTILAQVPFKDRTAFYKEHEALINEAAKRRS